MAQSSSADNAPGAPRHKGLRCASIGVQVQVVVHEGKDKDKAIERLQKELAPLAERSEDPADVVVGPPDATEAANPVVASGPK